MSFLACIHKLVFPPCYVYKRGARNTQNTTIWQFVNYSGIACGIVPLTCCLRWWWRYFHLSHTHPCRKKRKKIRECRIYSIMLSYNNDSVIFQQILQAGETWALSHGRPLASFCRFLSSVQITTSMCLTQSIYSPRRLIFCMPFHSSLFQCCHCDMNLKMDELYTGKQRWGGEQEKKGERQWCMPYQCN